MAKETERKFLITDTTWLQSEKGIPFRQGYIPTSDNKTTVRLRVAGDKGFLTIKGPAQNITRDEFEYEIPLQEARFMLEHYCGHVVEKKRYKIKFGIHIWEVDVFEGENHGLVLAEIELNNADEPFSKPPWLGKEVTGDKRYYNAWLAKHPYREWSDQ